MYFKCEPAWRLDTNERHFPLATGRLPPFFQQCGGKRRGKHPVQVKQVCAKARLVALCTESGANIKNA
jgi:hypothetical protein